MPRDVISQTAVRLIADGFFQVWFTAHVMHEQQGIITMLIVGCLQTLTPNVMMIYCCSIPFLKTRKDIYICIFKYISLYVQSEKDIYVSFQIYRNIWSWWQFRFYFEQKGICLVSKPTETCQNGHIQLERKCRLRIAEEMLNQQRVCQWSLDAVWLRANQSINSISVHRRI